MTRVRRVLVFGPIGPPHGGWSQVCRATVGLLRQRGFEVDPVQALLTRTVSGRDPLAAKSWRGIASLRRLRRRVHARRPDVAVVGTGPSASFFRDMLAAAWLRRHEIPVVLRLFGGNLDLWLDGLPPPVRHVIWHRLRRSASAVLVETRRLRDSLEGQGLRRVRWIPNFPTPELLHPVCPRRYVEGPLRIVYVGRLHVSKGLDTIAETLRRCSEAFPWEAELIGPVWQEAASRETLERRFAPLGSRCRLRGAMPPREVYARLAGAHVLLYPTEDRREGQPGAVIEAMAHGVVPVLTSAGGLAEMTRHGDGLLRIEAGDADGAVRKLGELARDRERLRRLGLAARERARREYSGKAAWTTLEPVLSSAVGEEADIWRSSESPRPVPRSS